MTSLGWTIYSIAYKDWEAAKGASAQKALLASILEKSPILSPEP